MERMPTLPSKERLSHPRTRFAVFASCFAATTLLVAAIVASAVDQDKKDGRVAGIMIDKGNDWLTVKADGEDESVKYRFAESDKKLTDAIKSVFNASRVQLTYRIEGEIRYLESIKKHVLKSSGTITGAIVEVHNDFWVEVKPKNGLADAYALGPANFDNKEFVAKLKALKPGDVVTIKYSTDFERHRIETLRKHDPPRSKDEQPRSR